MQRDRVRGNLRTLLLAAVAAEEPTHGYAVIASLVEVSDGVFSLNEGAVYPALHQLEADGLITSSWEANAGRRRRCYSLTDAGREQLRNDVEDWGQFRDGVEAILKEVRWLTIQ